MKLGATITSERGKAVIKTGNEYIVVNVKDENDRAIAELRVYATSDGSNHVRLWVEGIDSIDHTIAKRRDNLCNCGMNPGFHERQYNCKDEKTNESLRRDKCPYCTENYVGSTLPNGMCSYHNYFYGKRK